MKYKHDTRRMKNVTKLFYSEEVFDDSTSNQPKIRWRSRNFFSDNVDNGQKTQESDSYGESHIDPHGVDYSETQSGSRVAHMESDRTKFNPEPKQTGVSIEIYLFFSFPLLSIKGYKLKDAEQDLVLSWISF